MRGLAVILLVACHPSASVEHTTPIANLQSYQSVGLRVHTNPNVSGDLGTYMEQAVLDKLHQKCGYMQIGPADNAKSDLVVDVNITNSSRGGSGWVKNENQAFIDALVVLADDENEPLGTLIVHGKSSAALVGGTSPENEAVGEIAKTVVDVLAKSGCSGPRVAKAPPPPPNTGSAGQGSAAQGSGDQGSAATGTGTPAPDESKRADAEKLNDQGKEKLFAADLAGALALFQQANALLPDPKYQFNVCVALGAQEKWNDAISACNQAKSMNPPAKLAAKIDQRLEGLKNHQ
jgi:hypothetical protein